MSDSTLAGSCELQTKDSEIVSILSRHQDHLSRLSNLGHRIERLCDRLHGPTPCDSNKVTEEPKPKPTGIIEKLRVMNNDYESCLAHAETMMSRAEEAI